MAAARALWCASVTLAAHTSASDAAWVTAQWQWEEISIRRTLGGSSGSSQVVMTLRHLGHSCTSLSDEVWVHQQNSKRSQSHPPSINPISHPPCMKGNRPPHPPPVLIDTLTHFSGMLTDSVPLLLPASSCRPAAGVDKSVEVTQVPAQVKLSSSLRAKGRSSCQYETRCQAMAYMAYCFQTFHSAWHTATVSTSAAAAALAARQVNVIGHATRDSIRDQVLSHGILLPYDLHASPTAAAPSSAAVAAAAAALAMQHGTHVVWEARWRRWGVLHWAAPPASRRLP